MAPAVCKRDLNNIILERVRSMNNVLELSDDTEMFLEVTVIEQYAT